MPLVLSVTCDPQPLKGKSRPEVGSVTSGLLLEKGPPPKGWFLALPGDPAHGPGWQGPWAPSEPQPGDRLCSSLNGTLHWAAGNPLPNSVPLVKKMQALEDKLHLKMMSFQIAGVIF